MMIELARMVASALSDSTLGVNAQLAVMPRDGSDAQPPNIASVKNIADNDLTVREEDTTFPLLLVDVNSAYSGQGYAMNTVRDGTVEVTVAYVTESGDTAKNFRNTDYTLRAAAKAIHTFLFTQTGSDASRKRNNIAIRSFPTMGIAQANQPKSGGIMTGALTCNFGVRDTQPVTSAHPVLFSSPLSSDFA